MVGWTPQPGPKLGFVDGVRGWIGGLYRRWMFQRWCTQNFTSAGVVTIIMEEDIPID